ncbi:FAD binding domain-containing protein [Chloroflexota bacterium]
MMGPLGYFEPLTVKEAVSLLGKYREKAKIIAGGTDLVVMMKQRRLRPLYVISIDRIADLDYIHLDSQNNLQIGSLATIRNIQRYPHLQPRYKLIGEAAGQLASMAVRNVATIGGNLCNAAPSADMAPALIGLSATIKLVSTTGERIVSLEDFFIGPGTTLLKTDELLTEIQIPAPPLYSAGVYLKMGSRGAGGLAVVGIAAIITLSSLDWSCLDAKVVLGAVAPKPMRARKAEGMLKGEKLDKNLIENAAKSASDESSPIDDVRSSAGYRREMVKVYARDAIGQAVELAKATI